MFISSWVTWVSLTMLINNEHNSHDSMLLNVFRFDWETTRNYIQQNNNKNCTLTFLCQKGSIIYFFSIIILFKLSLNAGKIWILTFILLFGTVGFCWASCKLCDDAFCFKHQTLPLIYCDYALLIFHDKLKGIEPDMKMTFTCKWWNKAL